MIKEHFIDALGNYGYVSHKEECTFGSEKEDPDCNCGAENHNNVIDKLIYFLEKECEKEVS